MNASALVVVLLAIALLAIGGIQAINRRRTVGTRARAAWSLAGWGVVVLVGLAVWWIAQRQL